MTKNMIIDESVFKHSVSTYPDQLTTKDIFGVEVVRWGDLIPSKLDMMGTLDTLKNEITQSKSFMNTQEVEETIKMIPNERKTQRKRKRNREEDSRNKSKTLILKNLPYHNTCSDELINMYEEYGDIRYINVIRNKNGACKGIAFITFETWRGSNKCLKAHGKRYRGRPIWREYARTRKRKI